MMCCLGSWKHLEGRESWKGLEEVVDIMQTAQMEMPWGWQSQGPT